MALIKSVPDPQGPGTIDAYAKYGKFAIDTDLRVIDLDVSVYRSKEARDAVGQDNRPLYQPISVERYRVTDAGASGPDGPIPGLPNYAAFQSGDNANPQGIGAQIYGILKATPDWSGSTDA